RRDVDGSDVAAELQIHRGHARVGDAAGDEAVVPGHVHVAVEAEAVHRHSAGDADADRGDLALRTSWAGGQPHARAARHAPAGDAELGERSDEGLLDATHVVHDEYVGRELGDGVADQLPGPVERDLAAAVDVDDRGAVLRTLVRLGPFAGRVDGRVLQQQRGVADPVGHPVGVQLTLELPRARVLERVVAVPVLEVTHALSLRPVDGRWTNRRCHATV